MVQIQSMNSGLNQSEEIATTNEWTQHSVNFTTDSNASQVAVLFSPLSNTNVSIQYDAIGWYTDGVADSDCAQSLSATPSVYQPMASY